MRVFISMPMNGMTAEQVKEERRQAEEAVRKCILESEDIEFIDTWIDEQPDKPINNSSLWYLAKSIEMLSRADLAVFWGDWADYRGCNAEHYVAEQYGVPILGENIIIKGNSVL